MTRQTIKTTIKKWGNSLGVIIPRTIAEDLHLEAGTQIEVLQEDSELHIKITPALTLDAFLEGIPEDYQAEETDWGAAQGREEW